jgi:hypothetical protein
MWRPRDRERYIGSYDPEHEMPDPDRGPGDRWQSDAYRRGARDTRFIYRADPDRFENRFNDQRSYDPEYDQRWRRDARDLDRGGYGRGGHDANFGGGGYRDYGPRDFGRNDFGRNDYGRSDFGPRDSGRNDFSYGRDFDRGFDRGGWDRGSYDRGGHFDRDRFYGSDRGWDYDREDRYPSSRSDERDRWDGDRDDRWRNRRY